MSNPSDLFPWGTRVLMPLDPARTPCADGGEILVPLLVATLIVACALIFNAYRPFIKNLRCRLGIDRINIPPRVKRYGAFLLPFLLELTANLIIVGLFKFWPGYKNTFYISDMLMLGFIRPRMEWMVRWHNYFMWAGADARPELFEHSESLRPFLRRDNATSHPGLPRGIIPLAGEMLLQLYVLILVGGIGRYGYEHGFYEPDAKMAPHGRDFYNGIAFFLLLSGITLLHQAITLGRAIWKLIGKEREEQAPQDVAQRSEIEDVDAVNTDHISVGNTAESSLLLPSAADGDVQTNTWTWRVLITGVGALGLFFVAIGVWAANIVFWSGLVYSSKGR